MSNHQPTYRRTSFHLNTAQFHQKTQTQRTLQGTEGTWSPRKMDDFFENFQTEYVELSSESISHFVLDLQVFLPICDSTQVIQQKYSVSSCFSRQDSRQEGKLSNVCIRISQPRRVQSCKGSLKLRCQGYIWQSV